MNPVEEFLAFDGKEKTAAAPEAARGIGGFAARHPRAVEAAITGATAVGVPLALMAAHEGYQEIKGLVDRTRGYKRMMNFNPKLQKLPADRTKALYNTLHNAAPDLAKDPLVASSWINQTMNRDEYVDPRTLADLGSAQQRIGRKGLEFPIGQVTSTISGAVSDPLTKQLDRAQRAADSDRSFRYMQASDEVRGAMEAGQHRRDAVRLGTQLNADRRAEEAHRGSATKRMWEGVESDHKLSNPDFYLRNEPPQSR